MLPASQTPRSQSQRSATIGVWQIGLVVFLILYTLALGIGLLTGNVRPARAYLLFAIPCLLPMVWYAVGFQQRNDDIENDSGLLLSAVGWLLLAGSFLLKHFAILRAGADAFQASAPASFLCAGIGVLLIATGVIYSWQFWTQNYNS